MTNVSSEPAPAFEGPRPHRQTAAPPGLGKIGRRGPEGPTTPALLLMEDTLFGTGQTTSPICYLLGPW